MSGRARADRPRYCPQQPLPPYAYLPHTDPARRRPHPERDPGGHARADTGAVAHLPGADAPPDPAAWRTDTGFLAGVDRFNHGYFWEAHEAWEARWRAAAEPQAAAMLHGLIRLAAAGVKARVGNARGLTRHAGAAARLFRTAAAAGPCARPFGLAPQALAAQAADLADRGDLAAFDPELRPV